MTQHHLAARSDIIGVDIIIVMYSWYRYYGSCTVNMCSIMVSTCIHRILICSRSITTLLKRYSHIFPIHLNSSKYVQILLNIRNYFLYWNLKKISDLTLIKGSLWYDIFWKNINICAFPESWPFEREETKNGSFIRLERYEKTMGNAPIRNQLIVNYKKRRSFGGNNWDINEVNPTNSSMIIHLQGNL